MTLPEDYFCPKCNEKAAYDMVAKLRDEGMPCLQVVHMGFNILGAAGCPGKLLKPIHEWAKTYGKIPNELNEEEQEKLKLIRWNRNAIGGKRE